MNTLCKIICLSLLRFFSNNNACLIFVCCGFSNINSRSEKPKQCRENVGAGEALQQLVTSMNVLNEKQTASLVCMNALNEKQTASLVFQQQMLEELRSQKECAISGVDASVWREIMNHSKLRLRVSDLVSGAMISKSIPEFQWDDRAEAAQSDRYMQHLQKHITLRGRNVVWIRGDSDRSLLSAPACSVLPLRLNGTCDAALIWRTYNKSDILRRAGLAVVFELKKEVKESDERQAMAELLAASVLSPDFRPVSVLTDLRNCWRIYYCDGQAICCMYLDDQRDIAVGIIEDLVSIFEEPTAIVAPHGQSTGVAEGIFKRRKLETPETNLGGHPPPSDDVANLAELEPFLPAAEYKKAMIEKAMAQVLQIPCVQSVLMKEHEDAGVRTQPPNWGFMYS